MKSILITYTTSRDDIRGSLPRLHAKLQILSAWIFAVKLKPHGKSGVRERRDALNKRHGAAFVAKAVSNL